MEGFHTEVACRRFSKGVGEVEGLPPQGGMAALPTTLLGLDGDSGS